MNDRLCWLLSFENQHKIYVKTLENSIHVAENRIVRDEFTSLNIVLHKSKKHEISWDISHDIQSYPHKNLG